MLDHFGFLAPFYEKVIKPKSPTDIIYHSRLPVEGPILDLGGGTGRISQFLTAMGSQVINADLSIRMLTQAKEKPGLVPVCLESEKLPFADGYFSRIIMVDALHHVYNQQFTIEEMCRVVRNDGIIMIEEPDITQGSIKILALAEKLLLMQSHFLSPEEIALIFGHNGLKTQIVRDSYNAWVVAGNNL